MISQAKTNEGLYYDLREVHDDDEHPDWWFSPATRSDVPSLDESRSDVIDAVEGGRSDVPSLEQSDYLTPPPPRTPFPMGSGRGRPLLQEQSEQSKAEQTPSSESEQEQARASKSKQEQARASKSKQEQARASGFTQNEIDLLGANKIVRGQDGIWAHIEKEPSGRTIITPVNPIAELQRIASQSQGDAILETVNKNMIEQLQNSTQSIIKKVALNPTVFCLYPYVVSVRDPNTGLILFEGDLDEFINFCVRFTGEAYYGVVPTYVTNRPSLLTSLRMHQQRATYPDATVTYNQFRGIRID